jgi:hypothetical protein
MANRVAPGKNREATLMLGRGLLVGSLIGFLLIWRRRRSTEMPHLSTWQRAQVQNGRSELDAATLTAKAQARYEELCAQHPRIANRALRKHLRESILPGLALYQVLLEQNNDRDGVLREMERLFEAAFGGNGRFVPLLGRLPGAFSVFRTLTALGMRFSFPSEGWEIEWVQTRGDCLAFNMLSCFYLDVLSAYGVAELTPLYCRMDDLLFERLPPTISWERTETLGRGDEVCNFRWRYVKG